MQMAIRSKTTLSALGREGSGSGVPIKDYSAPQTVQPSLAHMCNTSFILRPP